MNRYLDGQPADVDQRKVCLRCYTELRRIWTVTGWSDWFHSTIEQNERCVSRWTIRG